MPAAGMPQAPAASRSEALAPALLVLLVVYVFGLAFSMQHFSYDVWGAIALAPVLIVISVPLLVRATRREGAPGMTRLIVLALVLKLVGALARYAVAYGVYGGFADAASYHEAGKVLAPLYRSGNFAAEIAGPGSLGTRTIKGVTGFVYALIGPSQLAGFVFFSWLGFWGLYLFYRAFVLAVPRGDARRYALLVFLLPSMLFWPSSIGKEAIITLTLGATAYGAARLFARRRGGLLVMAVGLAGTALIRSHVAMAIFVAVSVGYVVRRSRGVSPFAPVAKAIGLAALAGISVAVLSQVKDDLGIESLDVRSVQEQLATNQRNTTDGGSQFETTSDGSFASIPGSLVTILFRPWPFEASNLQNLIAALEGTLLAVLFFRSRRRLLAIPRQVRGHPYVVVVLVYTVLFAFAFSTFSNFGIVARQRVQLFPFVLVLLALPAAGQRRAPAPSPATPRRLSA